ncbi:MAG TPA: pitrilysin family protein [Bacteroidota bacterium]
MITRIQNAENRRQKAVYKASLNALVIALTTLIVFPAYGQKADRSKPPALGQAPTLKLPPVQRLKLSNGLPVVLMEKHDVPLVQINLIVNSGSGMDPAGKTGLAGITADMLDEGAGTRNALELADAIDFLGAQINPGPGIHTTFVTLHAPLNKLDQALPLMADIAMRPTFPAEELARKQKELLTTLMQWHDRPNIVANALFNKTLFGSQHPYGAIALGNEQSIRSFTTDDLKRFHAANFHAGNATLIVVGDVAGKTVLPKLEAAFGKWQVKAILKPNWPAAKQVAERRVYLADKPGAAQTEVRIGRIGVERASPDYFPLLVMNTILGGSFSSRLNQNIREEHGYAYGANSRFEFRPMPGAFLAASAVQTAVTDKALSEFMKELNAILAPVTEEEMTRAKNFLALGYPDGFQSVGQIAGQVGDLVIYNLPNDYFNTYIPRVLAVTKADVERVAKKYLDPEKIAIVLVGDRKVIEQGVRDLKLGPIDLLTIEDVLGKVPTVSN